MKKTRKFDFDAFKDYKKQLIKIAKVPNIIQKFHLNNRIYDFQVINFILQSEKRRIGYHKKISILDICTNLNCIIPHYCYHFNLSIAGNCRMCLVELSTSQKPIVSCAIDLAPNNNIKTETRLVKKAREGIMEFLLVNHPLDCPICDQGGECDLQDQSLIYGSDRGRFFHTEDLKRSVSDFMCHPMIKVILTRCIHCTRCVRFLNEIEGNYSLGMLGRGSNSEIGLYTKNILTSELGGNITDFCPVGALTIKSYALSYRAWDDLYFESIDISDSYCRSVRVFTDFTKVLRLLPQYDNELEMNWIHDRTRFLIDCSITQQTKYPLIIRKFFKKTGFEFQSKVSLINTTFRISWNNLTQRLINVLNYGLAEKVIKTFVGEYLDLFSLLDIKESSAGSGLKGIFNFSEKVLYQKESVLNEDFDSNYIYKGVDFTKYKGVILFNLNLRFENPLLNAKLRLKFLWHKNFRIFMIGSTTNLSYKYIHLGTTTKSLIRLVEAREIYLNSLFIKESNTVKFLLIYNSESKKCYKNESYKAIFNYLKNLENFLDISYLSHGASAVASHDLSIGRSICKKNYSFEKKSKEFLNYYIGCNQSFLEAYDFEGSKILEAHQLNIYQNAIFDKYFLFVDFFLPSYSHYETSNEFYLNCFGVLKMARQIFFPTNLWIKDNKENISFVFGVLKKNAMKKRERHPLKLKSRALFMKHIYSKLFLLDISKKQKSLLKHINDIEFCMEMVFAHRDLDVKKALFEEFSSIFLEDYKRFFNKLLKIVFFCIKEMRLNKKINSFDFHYDISKFNKNKELINFLNQNLLKNTINLCNNPFSVYRMVLKRKMNLKKRFHDLFYKTLHASSNGNNIFLKEEKTFLKKDIKIQTENKSKEILRVYAYLPLHLYNKRRLTFFSVIENNFCFSIIYFYLFTNKNKNFFKMSFLTRFSRNLNMISNINFSKKSNFNL